jgi:hypothetical protein
MREIKSAAAEKPTEREGTKGIRRARRGKFYHRGTEDTKVGGSENWDF